jgi:hypothetical protein
MSLCLIILGDPRTFADPSLTSLYNHHKRPVLSVPSGASHGPNNSNFFHGTILKCHTVPTKGGI